MTFKQMEPLFWSAQSVPCELPQFTTLSFSSTSLSSTQLLMQNSHSLPRSSFAFYFQISGGVDDI